MPKKKIIIVGVIAVVTVGIIIFGLTRINNQPASNKNSNANNTYTPLPQPTLPIPNPNLTYAAWIPDWDSKAGLVSLQSSAAKIQIVSPVWYEVRTDGSLVNKRPKNANDIAAEVNSYSGQLIPAIAMMDHEIFTSVLSTPENMERHISAIMTEISINNYAGIDLDYESTKLSDKDAYFKFIEELANRIHQESKQLIVTVLAKWGDDVIYPSLKETRQVQDWPMLSLYADEIRVMAYDYTYSKADKPGPIAPTSWIKKVLDYAVTKIPREKIILGIHLYSYEWWQELPVKSTDPADLLVFTENPDLNTSVRNITTRSYTYETVQTVLKNYKGTLTEFEGEKIYSYSATNKQTNIKENRVLVFINPAGVKARIDLAKEYGVKGVSFWRLGGETDLLQPNLP